MTASISGSGETGGSPAAPRAVRRSSYELLNDPLLNKGVAFTEAERDAFDLHGLLPPLVYTPTIGQGCQRFSQIYRKPTFTLSALALRSAKYIVRNWSSLA